MNKNLTLGSLFDGSGGFPLAGALNGITPLWASEIEPYPIAVTRSRFPDMQHYGDVSKIHGGDIPPVDVITFGSPCQDMSVAGKRAGMKHDQNGSDETTRSGLFYEAVRIIREMRESTNGKYPRYAVWENVPGAFSSQKGEDFRCVLQELAQIAEGDVSVPRPKDGKWLKAGEIVGNGWSIAWRVLDAQFWGVPQRRQRIYLAADFAAGRAGEILFERDGLRGDIAQSGTAREETAEDAAGSAGGSGCDWESSKPVTLKIRSGCEGGGKGALWQVDKSATLSTLNDQTLIFALQGNGIDRADTAGCNGCGWREDKCYTLNTIDRHSVSYPCYLINTMLATRCKALGRGTGFGVGEDGEPQFTISTAHEHAVCYAIDSLSSNSMKSPNPHSGFHAEAYAKCLDTSDQNPAKNQGGNVIVQQTVGALCARDYKGVGSQYVDEGKVVCYDARGNGDGKTCHTLTGGHEANISDYTAVCVDGVTPVNRKYIVRRLTPLECSRLQGFPDGWSCIQQLTEMDDAEAEFWENVRKTHAEVNGKKYKPCKDRQTLIKWHNGLHTDSAEYKMWGNGIALPCATFVLNGISKTLNR